MSFRRQLLEPRSSLVRTLVAKHGVSFGLLGKDIYVFGSQERQRAAGNEVSKLKREIKAELLTDDVIRRAQATSRRHVIASRRAA